MPPSADVGGGEEVLTMFEYEPDGKKDTLRDWVAARMWRKMDMRKEKRRVGYTTNKRVRARKQKEKRKRMRK